MIRRTIFRVATRTDFLLAKGHRTNSPKTRASVYRIPCKADSSASYLDRFRQNLSIIREDQHFTYPVASEQDPEEWQTTLEEELDKKSIHLPRYSPGTYRLLCPECEGGSTGEITLSVTIDETHQHALYHCFRATCGWAGVVRSSVTESGFVPVERESKLPPKIVFNGQPLDEECLEFFAQRDIPEEVINRNRIQMEVRNGKKYIAFPYYLKGELVNVKFRAANKKEFSQMKGGRSIFYGLDDVVGAKEVIVVEGEMDKLALEAVGFRNVVSVPNGAPAKLKEFPSSSDAAFKYVESASEFLADAEKIILATDNDECGNILAEELARRFGYWKCYKVKWPSDFNSTILPDDCDVSSISAENAANVDVWFRKDANQVLMTDSESILKGYIEDAEPYPVNGIVNFLDFFEDIQNHYLLKTLCPSGFSTGWPGLDRYYKVVPGELTVVSGVPNSGKSEWLDSIAVNLAERFNWSIAFASMEKLVWDHGRQLIEKHIRKPFFDNVHYAKGVKRMSVEEVREGILWINDKFPLIVRQDDELVSIDWILDRARLAVLRYGIRGLVIDPYNEMDHGRDGRITETEFVNTMLSKIKRFAQCFQVHVWLVAHPRQLYDWKGEPPNLYDISGSAHFVNKADAGVVIHRNWQKFNENDKNSEEANEDDQYLVRVIVRKMRNKAAGRTGEHVLRYNPVDGTYSDPYESEQTNNAFLNTPEKLIQ